MSFFDLFKKETTINEPEIQFTLHNVEVIYKKLIQAFTFELTFYNHNLQYKDLNFYVSNKKIYTLYIGNKDYYSTQFRDFEYQIQNFGKKLYDFQTAYEKDYLTFDEWQDTLAIANSLVNGIISSAETYFLEELEEFHDYDYKFLAELQNTLKLFCNKLDKDFLNDVSKCEYQKHLDIQAQKRNRGEKILNSYKKINEQIEKMFEN